LNVNLTLSAVKSLINLGLNDKQKTKKIHNVTLPALFSRIVLSIKTLI